MAFINDHVLRMPLADEEELPYPRTIAGLDIDLDLDFNHGLDLLFFPSTCWKQAAQMVLDAFRETDAAAAAPNTDEEAAEDGANPPESDGSETREPELYRRIYDHHYHQNHCPYHGGCPAPYHYRTSPRDPGARPDRARV